MEQKLMELELGCHEEMEKQGTGKGAAPAVHTGWNEGFELLEVGQVTSATG